MAWSESERYSSEYDGRPLSIEFKLVGNDEVRFIPKWDGCVNFATSDGQELLCHVCDLPRFIKDLQELLEICREYWPDNYKGDS